MIPYVRSRRYTTERAMKTLGVSDEEEFNRILREQRNICAFDEPGGFEYRVEEIDALAERRAREDGNDEKDEKNDVRAIDLTGVIE